MKSLANSGMLKVLKDYNDKGKWIVKDSIREHDADMDDQNVENLTDHAFSEVNRHLYFNPKNSPKRSGVQELDNFPQEFQPI